MSEQIPLGFLVPGFWAGADNSRANTSTGSLRPLDLIGHKNADGSASVNTLSESITSQADAGAAYGYGSQLARMYEAAREAAPLQPIRAIAVPEPTDALASVSLTITGPATAAGTLHLYCSHVNTDDTGHYQIPVSSADTAANIALAARAAINIYGSALTSGSPVEGALYEIVAHSLIDFTSYGASANTVGCVFRAAPHDSAMPTLTAADSLRRVINGRGIVAEVLTGSSVLTLKAQHPGLYGNQFVSVVNLLGSGSGQVLPAGVGITPLIGSFTGGTAAPSLAAAVTALGDHESIGLCSAFSDSSSLTALQAWVDRRWGATVMKYGHVFAAKNLANATILTDLAARNNPGESPAASSYRVNAPDEIAAAFAAEAVQSLQIKCTRPLHTLQLKRLTPAPLAYRYTDVSLQNQILTAGGCPLLDVAGVCTLSDVPTTYKTNAAGVADNSWKDTETRYAAWYVMDYKRSMFLSRFPRVNLVDDASDYGPGDAVVDVRLITSALIEYHDALALLGIVEKWDGYASQLSVTRVGKKRVRIVDPEKLQSVFSILDYTLSFT